MRYSLEDIAKEINGQLFGPPDLEVLGVNTPNLAKKTDICIILTEDFLEIAEKGDACAIVLKEGLTTGKPYIWVKDPRAAMPRLLGLFEKKKEYKGVHKTAIVGENTSIPFSCYVGPYVVIGNNVILSEEVVIMAGSKIGDNVVIGEKSLIGYNVIIEDNTTIGKRVKIHAGSVIGKEGFGFYKDGNHYIRIPHLGNVVIEDDVEIGANSVVDKATLGSTIIKRGTKIDSLVLIAHNVTIGEDVAIAGQTGIAGSVEIEDRCMFGGQVGIADHIKVGEETIAMAQTGIIGDIPPRSIISGTPARPHREWLKAQSALLRLPELIRRLKKDEADNP
ncbi:MAG: UDP-3-O-(3-hydroxymyristoyl)glucosamine N-acyltransferase [bacterium]